MTRITTHNLADDHPEVLRGLAALLETEPRIEIVAACASGTEALAAIREHAPDIAVLDIAMPGLSGLDVARSSASEALAARIVLLTASATDRQREEAREAGVSALIFKDSAPDQLLKLIATLAPTNAWPLQSSAEETASAPNLLAALTPRERQIAQLLCEGISNKQIARQLSLAEATVKTHLHNVFTKTGLISRTALTALFIRSAADGRTTRSVQK
jgi:two-component system nitrate/nitrite response regulator NarL